MIDMTPADFRAPVYTAQSLVHAHRRVGVWCARMCREGWPCEAYRTARRALFRGLAEVSRC